MAEFPTTRNVLEPGCDRCPDLASSRESISWGTGPLDAEVVVIGEAPGAGDPAADRWRGGNWTGMAYTTRHSGRRIRSLVADIGRLEEAYFTNAVKCFPATQTGEGREPTPTERRTCRTHLETELEAIRPAVVLPTGRHATASVLSLDGRTVDGFVDTVLEPLHLEVHDITVIPLLHPSYADVWRSRLGLSRSEYVDRVRSEVEAALDHQ